MTIFSTFYVEYLINQWLLSINRINVPKKSIFISFNCTWYVKGVYTWTNNDTPFLPLPTIKKNTKEKKKQTNKRNSDTINEWWIQ